MRTALWAKGAAGALLVALVIIPGCRRKAPKDASKNNGPPPAMMDAPMGMSMQPAMQPAGMQPAGMLPWPQVAKLAKGRRDPAAFGCKADADCALGDRRDGSCCGHKCHFLWYIYRKDFIPQLKAHQQKHCAKPGGDCPQAKCSRPQFWKRAVCRGGFCVSTPKLELTGGPRRDGNPPRIFRSAQQAHGCRADSDCVLTCEGDGRCDTYGCRPCKTAYNKAFLADVQRLKAAYCKPGTFTRRRYRCAMKPGKFGAKCTSGRCVRVKVGP